MSSRDKIAFNAAKDQSGIQFSITTVPCRQLCLLTFLAARALADDAFDAGYTSPRQVFSDEPLEEGVDYVPLPWKLEMLSKAMIVPISYNTYWNIWNRTLFVAGLRDRDKMRPYAMKVGAGQRLDGSLTAPLRNYILSNSSEGWAKRRDNLPDELRSLKTGSSCANLLTKDDLTMFERRRDLSSLRKQYREAKTSDPTRAQKIKGRIKYLLDWLERLRIEEMRQEYFNTVDKLRARGARTEHLRTSQYSDPRKQRVIVGTAVASLIGTLLNDDIAPAVAGELLLSYLQGKLEGEVFSHQESGTSRESRPSTKDTRCLLCNHPYSNTSSLTRHVRRHHGDTFREPFNCLECRRVGKTCQISALPSAWSNHVRSFHGKKYTPNLWSQSTSLKLEGAKRGRSPEDTLGAPSKRTRQEEDDYTMGDFRVRWEQTPDPHAGEEFWVTGRECDQEAVPYSCTDEEGCH
ncbi:hypothetical protein B0H66DRAFT_615721 [Apodospora peruviana]|uniref:C2H2-type domain-containing protein n=1 Tax=Apodospora peruviana TaxID=516989 RepID=A0AAE0IHI7_9PEZI|nr:hypothetical protein B0H66DRAFT_615721 [Apodospora peruviana]